MKLISVIATLMIQLVYFILFINCTLLVPHTLKCDNKYELDWLWNLRNNNRCVNIIIGTIFVPQCFFDQIFNLKFVIRMSDLNTIVSRNIFSFQRTNCDNFLFFTQNSREISQLFEKTNRTVKRFLPFSQLFFVDFESNVEFNEHSLDYMYENGLFVYVAQNTLSATSSNLLRFSSLRNVLTNDILNLDTSNTQNMIHYFGMYKNHPVLNSKLQKKQFRVSFFRCSPYVVYLPDGTFDGLEYRVLKEIMKNWTIEYKKCDTSAEIRDPYGAVRGQVENHESDLAMCSVWLNEKSNTYLDVTSHINYECATFLVPKPENLNPATYLYKSIRVEVGWSVVISMISTSIILTVTARIGRKLMNKSWTDLVYVSLSRSSINTFGILTSQSLVKFPKENSMKSLFLSWSIVSLLVGVVFSTGYTSLLTKPPSSKPIDTIADFLENSLVFDRKGKSNLAKAFFDTGIDIYIQLSTRNIEENGTEVAKEAMETNKLAHFAKVLSNDYIAEITETTDPEYKLRLMKTCLFNHFTVVALQKCSSYTQFFREKIGILQQIGIISHWRSSIEVASNGYMRPYFQKLLKTTTAPKKISLDNLGGAFWLLIGGHFVAYIVFVAENLLSYRKKLIILEDQFTMN